jgi:acyl-CoA reductase-like NAD-dependent aldehyde dehydrogenase
MTPTAKTIKDHGISLPEVLTSYLCGASTPLKADSLLLPIHFAGTGEHFISLQEDDVENVDRAVKLAREGFVSGAWSEQSVAKRQSIFRRVAELIRQNAQELALLDCVCAGLPLSHLASRQIPRAAENFDFFADYIGTVAGENFDQMDGYQTVVTRQPAGVVALFVPWNAPLAMASMHVASALAFGNTCVLKPSEFAPLSALRLATLLEEAGLPVGTCNVINGRGSVTGAALASHAGIDRIALTGQGHTARKIMSNAAEHLTPVHFELGGKSANIIFDDANLDQAIDGALVSSFSNAGQICVAGSRILVQRGIAESFIKSFVARTKALRVGNPLDPHTEVGPLAFEAQKQRVLDCIARAKEEGAQLLVGENLRPDLGDGYFVAPTLFQVETNQLAICQEEVLGPVTTIQVFDTDKEALSIANDSRFGLVGYCWTESLPRALAFQQGVEAGTLWINTPLARDLRAPFGGFKESGIGRDGPRHAAAFFTEEKSIITALKPPTIRKMGQGNQS